MLAGGLAASMILITSAVAVWWGAMATDAPFFLDATAPGRPASPFSPELTMAMGLMLASRIVGIIGVVRMVTASSRLDRASAG